MSRDTDFRPALTSLAVLAAVLGYSAGTVWSAEVRGSGGDSASLAGSMRGGNSVPQQQGCPPTGPTCVVLEPIIGDYGDPEVGVGNLSFLYTGTWGSYGWNDYWDVSTMWAEAVSTDRWYAEAINLEDWTVPYDNSHSYHLYVLVDPQGEIATEAFSRVRTRYRVKTLCPDTYPDGTPVAISLTGDFSGYKYGVEPEQQRGRQYIEFGFTVADDLYYYDAHYEPSQMANEFLSSGGVYERHTENGVFGVRSTVEFASAVGRTFEIDGELYAERGNENPNDWISEGALDITVETPDTGGSEECPVPVDIKPGSCPNPMKGKSKGVLPVAVLGTAGIDVRSVDPATIRLTREGYAVGVAPLRWSYEDVATPFEGELCDCHEAGPDGFEDLTLKFNAQEVWDTLDLGVEGGNTIPLLVTGTLGADAGGTPLTGSDCVRVLAKRYRPNASVKAVGGSRQIPPWSRATTSSARPQSEGGVELGPRLLVRRMRIIATSKTTQPARSK